MDTKSQTKAVLQIGKYLRSNCDKILDKSVPFVIDSALFWFITEAIRSLISNEATLFPDTSNGFYDYVMFLSDFFEQTPSLCITLTEAVKGVNSIPGNLDLLYFRSLHFLELRKIPPVMITSLHAVKTNLRKLKCSRCLDSISEILSSQHCCTSNNNNAHDSAASVPHSHTHTHPTSSVSVSVTLVWPELKEIDASFNRISCIDSNATDSFQLTPSVESLNLSRNKILTIDDSFTRVLNSLRVLNLNYNQLKMVPPVPPNLKVLLLSHNYITSLTTTTFSLLKHLEVLDLSTNMIADENELDPIGSLSHLKTLMLLGNPVSYLENYRDTVCSSMNRLVLNRAFVLDGKRLSISEVRRALERMRFQKFVPFMVASDPSSRSFDGEDGGSTSSRPSTSSSTMQQYRGLQLGGLANVKSLTQSYDSSSSSIRSSRRKKAKIREPHVFDPDEDGDDLAVDDSDVKSLKGDGAKGHGQSDDSGGSGSEKSEIAVVTRNAIELLREKYGEENWLLKQAGVEVAKLMGIPVLSPNASVGLNINGSNNHSNSSYQNNNSKSSAILSQSLPSGTPNLKMRKSESTNSFYTTAIEYENEGNASVFGPNNTDTFSSSTNSNSTTVQEDFAFQVDKDNDDDDSKSLNASNVLSDDSLVFYPCHSETGSAVENWTDDDNIGHGGYGSNSELSGQGKKGSEPFRFKFLPGSTSTTTPLYPAEAEIFSDPEGKASEFRYFQSGQMFKLIVLDNYLYEIDKEDGGSYGGGEQKKRILAKWDLKIVDSITDEKRMSETETVEFTLTFDTIKKNLRERTFVMTCNDFDRFEESIGSYLQSRTMQEFAEAFQCLKCNAQFSKGMADKTVRRDKDGTVIEVPICNNPDCRSEMLVLLDSTPLPNNESLNVEQEIEQLKEYGKESTPISGVPTTAQPIQDTRFFRVPLACSTPTVVAAGFNYNDVPREDDIDSKVIRGHSRSGSGPGSHFNGHGRVITPDSPNPSTNFGMSKSAKSSSEPTSLTAINTKSESDVETLSCNSSSIEVLGNHGDSGSGSDIVEVPEAVELSLPEMNRKPNRGGGGNYGNGVNMTDSTTSSGSCADSIITTYERKNNFQSQSSHQNSPTRFSTSSMNSAFSNSCSSTVTVVNQSVASLNSPMHRLDSFSSPIKYDYEDFSKVDHRLQLFCEISVFKGSDERLLALAKVVVICDSNQFAGIVIFSNKKLYIYKIIGLEGDKPDSWLQRVKSFGLEKLVCINVLIGRHGVGIELQGKYYALLFRDSHRTSNFLECFLGDICGELEAPPLVRDFSQTHKALLSPSNPVVYFGVLRYASCGNEKSHISAILVTDVDVIFISDLNWMGATRHGNVTPSQIQQLSTLRQVETHESDENFVRLIFGSSNHAFWELYFESMEEKTFFVTNLQPCAPKGVPFISLSQPIEP